MTNYQLFHNAMLDAIDACADLTQRGCRLRSAHINGGTPSISIAPPPHGVFTTYARCDTTATYATAHNGVRVEWPDIASQSRSSKS